MVSSPPHDVHLRDVIDADLPRFFEHQRDPDATRMAAFPAKDREDFTAHWTKILANETIIKQTILVDGQVAGNIVCFTQFAERQVGYWLGKEYWGQGVATRALAAFLAQVRERPLYAHVAKHNTASLRVLEKCGFRVIGEEVEEFILALGGNDGDTRGDSAAPHGTTSLCPPSW